MIGGFGPNLFKIDFYQKYVTKTKISVVNFSLISKIIFLNHIAGVFRFNDAKDSRKNKELEALKAKQNKTKEEKAKLEKLTQKYSAQQYGPKSSMPDSKQVK